MNYRLIIIPLLLAGGLWGCLEVIRRPPAGRSAPAWSTPENPPRSSAVKSDTTADPIPAASLPLKRGPAPKKPAAEGERQRLSVKQVNEYALWCIENGMWKEARLHLEQAAARDSQAASLHNNLGIVYEHLGLEEQAADAYGRAQALRPERAAYQVNIQRFEGRQRAARPDSAAPPQAGQDTTGQAPPASPTGD